MATYVHTTTDGKSTTKTPYSCNKKSMQYTVIGEDIKNDFSFLLDGGSICTNLDEVLKYLDKAASVATAFYFENGATVSDIQHVYEEIYNDINRLKQELVSLHSAFMTDIDNVNAELEINFGHWVGAKVNAGRSTTTTNE